MLSRHGGAVHDAGEVAGSHGVFDEPAILLLRLVDADEAVVARGGLGIGNHLGHAGTLGANFVEVDRADDLGNLVGDECGEGAFVRKQHATREPRPLDGLVSPEPSDQLFAIPAAIDLRNYLDAHVPDVDNDYAFADRVMEDILALFYEGARVSDLPTDLGDLGLMDCTDDPKTLIQLATNLYYALPAWDLYGWSSQELMERATGQKTFYNPDGSVRKVGRNEPCPCGSGKKYKNCCGRGARE